MVVVITPYGDNGAMAVVLMMTIEVIGSGGLRGESDNDVNGFGTAGSDGTRSFTDLSAGSSHMGSCGQILWNLPPQDPPRKQGESPLWSQIPRWL